MVAEVTIMSARDLIRSAYQERRLYRMANQLYKLIISLPATAGVTLGDL